MASERWLWQQGGRDVKEGSPRAHFSGLWGNPAALFRRMLWGANIPSHGFGDRISWLAATRGCPAPAPELPLLGITAALMPVLEEPEYLEGFWCFLVVF